MVVGQSVRPLRADLEHRAQRQPHVVDRGDPGVGIALGQLEPPAIGRQVSRRRWAAARLASMMSGSCRLRSAR